MPKKYIKFSEQEDIIIHETVKKYPGNIYYAFEEATKVLKGRNFYNVKDRWYRVLRHNTMVSITCGSSEGFTHNVKNVWRDKEGNLPDQELEAVDKVMSMMLSLSKSGRNKILKYFRH